MLFISMASIRSVQIAMSLASIDVIFMEWTWSYLTTELSDQMWSTTVTAWDFLTLSSAMTAVLLEEIWDDLKVWLRLWRYWYKFLSDKEEREWKLILPEKWLTTLEPGEKRGWKGLKQFLMLLRHSLTSLMGLLRLAYCFMVSLEVTALWEV